jgi:ABC-type polysaccharide/polyol phosphate export permease
MVKNMHESATIRRIRKLYTLLPPLLWREMKERYAGSVFGIFWTFLQPLLFIMLYWLVFARVIRMRIPTDTGDIPFFPFLLTGLLPWFALQEGVLRGASSILDKRHVIKKVLFPTELFPFSSVLTAFIHYSVGILIFLAGFFVWKGTVSMLQIAYIPVLLLMQILLTLGVALLFSSLTVYIRDITQILSVAFQVFFYLSSILYPLTAVPAKLKIFILLNPVTALVEAYHSVILYGRPPTLYSTVYLLGATTVALFCGIFVFRKLKRGFADVL